MANNTKTVLGAALKRMIAVKPISKITVKDLVEQCGINRQTFYYHFDDVYDLLEWIFEQDAEKVLPKNVETKNWQTDVRTFFAYLYQNRDFVLNLFNSNSRTYMLRFYERKLETCIRAYAEEVSRSMVISRPDYEFVILLFTNTIIGIISQWIDRGMIVSAEVTVDRCMIALEGSMESLLGKFAQ